MPYINVGTENSGNISLHYEDHGAGKPVVLIHGFPLSGRAWEKQVPVLMGAGYRVITYDRRGFGDSSQPTSGYAYDTFAEDLHKLIMQLDLRDAALVGHSMGGGEVARYLGTYGSERVSKAVIMSGVPPFLMKTPDNPDAADKSLFDGIQKAIAADRPAYLSQFLTDFYNFDVFGGKRVSQQVVQSNWNIAAAASPQGTYDCVSAWLTDFRKDLTRIDVPTLVLHGDADRICPFPITGKRTQAAIRGSQLTVIEGGPHGIAWTHAEQVNQELVSFLGKAQRTSQVA
jgi:pimeloyl-ACP methyl ester carboxylesterase